MTIKLVKGGSMEDGTQVISRIDGSSMEDGTHVALGGPQSRTAPVDAPQSRTMTPVDTSHGRDTNPHAG